MRLHPVTSSTDTTRPVTPSVGTPDQTTETAAHAAVSDPDFSTVITAMADRSSCQTDFLRSIATDLANQFPVDLVVVTHPTWDSPMMSISESASHALTLAQRLDGDFVNELLASSTSAPTACDLPLRAPASSDHDDTSPHAQRDRTRGLHIQLIDGEHSSAVLLVYSQGAVPDPATQIRDLKRLALYARQCRDVIAPLANQTPTNCPTESHPVPDSALTTTGWTTNRSGALRHFHFDLNLAGTAYRIANETRRILDVDRVSVLIAQRGRFRIESVSGVAVVDRRANAIAAAEQFAQRAIVLGRPITLPSDEPLPPQIAEPFDHYLDQTDVNSVTVMPLYCPPSDDNRHSVDSHNNGGDRGRLNPALFTEIQSSGDDPIAILLMESFTDQLDREPTPAMREVAAEAAIALSNALEHRRIFGLRFLKTLGDWFGGRRLPYTLIAGLAATGLLVASMIIQMDHKIIATGFAEPTIQQNVFARTDGIVKEIFVTDGQQISAGDVLMRLENADLETNAESLSGEILTTSSRLASISAMLLDPATDEKQATRLTIEERQLQSELTNRQNQLALVQHQLSELEIKSPIDGTVAGWQMKRKLSDRPVGRGNHLLTVVRNDGPWQLRLAIPDKDAAEVIRAHSERGKLEVEFAAASHPESTFAATLDSIATTARRNQDGVVVLDAEAVIMPIERDPQQPGIAQFVLADARSGVETTAKINCGRRSILSSWFGDVSDFFNRNVLFYVR